MGGEERHSHQQRIIIQPPPRTLSLISGQESCSESAHAPESGGEVELGGAGNSLPSST